ncbi:MAG: transcriptional regulator, partial [archaeon]
MRYVILNNDKKPKHKLIGSNYTYEDVKLEDNVGLIVPEPMVVFDIDDMEEGLLLLKIIEAKNIKCKIMKTTRGFHFWFKSDEPITNYINKRTAIGIHTAIRSYGKMSFVVIK